MYECLIEGGADRSQGFGCTHIQMEPGCPGCDHWHSGWDLAAPCGRAVYASCAGLVVAIGDDPGYGPHAVFLQRETDGMVELYGHLQDNTVNVGDRVAAGQAIGHVGTLGHSTGCHLHYSVRPPADRLTECGALDPGPYICSCTGSGVRTSTVMPLSGLAVLMLLDPDRGHIISSPAAPGLGITWEP